MTTLSFPEGSRVIAEGFGLTPDLVAPLLRHPRQAVWLAPTDDFKRASMQRRGKGRFDGQVSDPERARSNLLERDRLLAEHIAASARRHGLTVITVDGSETVETMSERLARRFIDLT